MKQNDQFKELAKKAYLNYHEDGIVDLIMGTAAWGCPFFCHRQHCLQYVHLDANALLHAAQEQDHLPAHRLCELWYPPRPAGAHDDLHDRYHAVGHIGPGHRLFPQYRPLRPFCPQMARGTPHPDTGVDICRHPSGRRVHNQHPPAVHLRWSVRSFLYRRLPARAARICRLHGTGCCYLHLRHCAVSTLCSQISHPR